jgi:hypothetical protein
MGLRKSRRAVPGIRPGYRSDDVEAWFRNPGGAEDIASWAHAEDQAGYARRRERELEREERRARRERAEAAEGASQASRPTIRRPHARRAA